MEQIYLAFVDTPGFFASIIRRVIGIPYVHVVLSMDADLREAYSVGRRNPAVPLIAGFEKENTLEIEAVFPHAKYKVVRMQCTAEQKKSIARQLLQCYKQRKRYHYCIIGLPFILFQIPFYQKNHYTCSSFVTNILEQNGISLFQKHFSLVTPRDFYELEQTVKEMFFQGGLTFNDEVYITNVRQKEALLQAFTSLSQVKESIESGMPEDFYTIDLMDAYEALGNITGETIGEDLVNEIFSKFCMGK